jgi:hypothetical protein
MSIGAEDVWGQGRLRFRPPANRAGLFAPSNKAPSRTITRGVSLEAVLAGQPLSHYHRTPSDLVQWIDQSLTHQQQFPDTAENRSPWGVMHNTLAWGQEGVVLIEGQSYNAIQALCENQPLKGVRLLEVGRDGLKPLEGPGLQGHPGQLLAILAQNDVALDQPLKVGDQSFTVADLVQYEKQSCRPNQELTFKLLGLSYYVSPDEIWTASDGGKWSLERLLRLELRLPINQQQTCGGVHRLMAIHLAVQNYHAYHRKLAEALEVDSLTRAVNDSISDEVTDEENAVDLVAVAPPSDEIGGAWKIATDYMSDYQDYAFTLFNPDGSFSTDWLERRAALEDPQRRVQTTGHVLEWLVVSLPENKLHDPALMQSLAYLAGLLQVDIGETWSVGPRAHALRALRLYRARIESADSSTKPQKLAEGENTESLESSGDGSLDR